LILPPLEVFCDGDAKKQVMMWRRAKDWLRPEKIAEANRTGSFKPDYNKTINFLKAMEAHWANLREGALEHPDYFDWPDTKIWLGSGTLSTRGWLNEGVLGVFGYSVGEELNLSKSERRRALDAVFKLNIPPIFGWDQLNQWGEPKTPLRLQKMANCLASFARNAKHRKTRGLVTAITRWESDLAYLKKRYYRGKFKFGFPDTKI